MLTTDTARTGLVVTEGHEAILVLREGGRADAFDFTYDYPEPYVPQELTFSAPERIGASGEVVIELTEQAAADLARALAAAEVEAVAVCLLWSVVNPSHELLLGSVFARELPGVPVTLSHELNPSIREYRRASSAAINASLRPLMGAYLSSMRTRLREAGFAGRVLVVSSTGALLDAEMAAVAPVHLLNSGPSMGPVAGAHELRGAETEATAIVVDCGGTSFDVSIVERGRIPRTRETWIGPRFRGFMTGFPSVDVRSVGAGGGSIARVDEGGLLLVGPDSAGSVPGPVAYGRGGRLATVTDAALVLGYLDPARFLGGAMKLQLALARSAVGEQIAAPLGLDVESAAAAVLDLATEIMIQAVVDVTTSQGVDPGDAVLIGGGGAAGLNLAAMAARLGCQRALLPDAAAGLSAAGALVSELGREFAAVHWATTSAFDRGAVNATLDELVDQCEGFIAESGADAVQSTVQLFAEARYPRQVWELEVPLRVMRFERDDDLAGFVADFHAAHVDTFAFSKPGSVIEVIGWRARVSCGLSDTDRSVEPAGAQNGIRPAAEREAYFAGIGVSRVPVHHVADLPVSGSIAGPAIIETDLTTVVVGPGRAARRRAGGGVELSARKRRERRTPPAGQRRRRRSMGSNWRCSRNGSTGSSAR